MGQSALDVTRMPLPTLLKGRSRDVGRAKRSLSQIPHGGPCRSPLWILPKLSMRLRQIAHLNRRRFLTGGGRFHQHWDRPLPSGASGLASAPGFIRILCQVAHDIKERRRLTDEESHSRQEIERTHGDTLRFCRTDDGASRKLSAQKGARLGHDQVRLEILTTKRWRI